ncbi:GNAT family N-acetyltransferase [Chitinophaga oryzae]|uniref:GNAT family N-acetyltransferase n=1 Tax=Chitinophaga oryzae TaxID=2725414 RepID=A0AAE6ZFW6_9BACT|nr:GNAT family N-acetyltransferase [Chitinophaga oryzae]QJB30767.1 GNAT family N-acetyltransferase [Chitinophaga oryzae]QJB37269.1 GNAT family N-acetyltransferase [Chitinophaga oryzae]
MTITTKIRPLQESDNHSLGAIIQQVLEEFNANKPGTAYFDKNLYELHSAFNIPNAAYWIAEADGRVVGGAGIFPVPGLPPAHCELVKLYLLPEARGLGLGKQLIAQCLQSAGTLGYSHVYLETMPELKQAIPLYEKMGFSYLPAPLGAAVHFGCSIWMIKAI